MAIVGQRRASAASRPALSCRRRLRRPYHRHVELRPAGDGDDPRARHLDVAERRHQLDEGVDLAWISSEFEDEALKRAVDGAGAEGVGQAQRLDALRAGVFRDVLEVCCFDLAALEDEIHRAAAAKAALLL